MMINICKSIKCPYFGEGKYYGCQRYVFSCGCHLRMIKEFVSTEYILCVDESEPVNIQALEAENNRFFLEDPKYKSDLDFQKTHSDWFGDKSFKVSEII